MKLIDLSGRTFDRLTVVGKISIRGITHWECKCSCGGGRNVLGGYLTSGRVTSCGCKLIECGRRIGKLSKTHGMSRTPERRIWEHMMHRCHNESDVAYHNYGGRGIYVCERWKKFENFLSDMGNRPFGKTLERIRNNEGYAPDNCRWATPVEQARNKRNNHSITAFGKTQVLQAWAEEKGIAHSTIRMRLLSGWSPEEAVGG